jgi:MFS family permease
MPVADRAASEVDSPYAWMRLAVAVALSTIGGVGLWSIVVALPAVQAEFGTARADASLPYTLTTLGFAAGGVMMGRLADRFGVMWPVLLGTVSLSLGYILSARAEGITGFAVTYGALIGLFGSCAMFGPLVADTSLWFRRRRGLAVRAGGFALRQRQLLRRRGLAAAAAMGHRRAGLAADPCAGRRHLPLPDAAAGAGAAAEAATAG